MLFNAERAWAYGMELKDGVAAEPRKHFHMLKKLKKAVSEASELEKLCTPDICDQNTIYQTQVFFLLMNDII